MSARSHTANSWARVNHDLQFRSIIEKVEALSEETRKTKQMEAETHQMVQYLQARLHALAAAVAELPGVFQSSVAEIIAEQERLHADLQLCRQQMREHKAEVTAMLIDVRQACGTAVAADHTRASERVAALEAQVEAAVATQQRLHLEAVEWNKTRRRLVGRRLWPQPPDLQSDARPVAHALALPCLGSAGARGGARRRRARAAGVGAAAARRRRELAHRARGAAALAGRRRGGAGARVDAPAQSGATALICA
jgi:hypothetical protein